MFRRGFYKSTRNFISALRRVAMFSFDARRKLVRPHLFLHSNLGWYRRWHNFKYHKAAHTALLSLYIVLTLLGALGLNPQQASAANGTWDFGTQGARNGSGANIADTASGIELQKDWWDTNYKKRQKVTVNSTDAVASGYSVKTDVDIEDLRRNGKTQNDLDDLRVVATDRSSNTITELDRDIVRGESISLDGSSDYIQSADAASLEPTSNLTVEAWIKLNTLSQWQHVVQKGSHGGGDGYNGYYLRTSNTNTVQAYVVTGTDSEYVANTTSTLSADTWYHLAMVYDGSELRVYIDGQEDGTPTVASGNIDYTGGQQELKIGANKNGGTPAYHFDGQIDEVRISDSVRYASNFTPQLTPFTPDSSAKGLWHLDDDAADSSGNGNTGTLNGSPYYTEGKVVAEFGEGQEIDDSDVGLLANWKMNNNWTDSSGYGRTGTRYGTGTAFSTGSKLGSHAGQFNGSDDYVNTTSVSGLGFTNGNPFSVEAWVKTSTNGTIVDTRPNNSNGFIVATNWVQLNGATSYHRIHSGSPGVLDNKWHHIVASWDGTISSTSFKYFVDGVDKTSTFTYASTAATIGGSITSLNLGYSSDLGKMNGLIDETSIYSKVLSPSEIYDHYNAKSEVYFKTQSAIDASSTSEATGNHSYYLYYDYPSAVNPPENRDNVYILYDDFENGTIDASRWPTTLGSPSESNGLLSTNYTSSGGDSMSEGITSNSISIPEIQIEWKQKGSNRHRGVSYSTTGQNIYWGTATNQGISTYQQQSGGGFYGDGYDTARHWTSLLTSDDSWHDYKMIWDGTNARYQVDNNAELQQAFSFTPSNWKIGIGNNGFDAGVTQDTDFIKARAYTTNEPTATLATEEDTSGWATGMGSWTYKQKVTFDTTASRANVALTGEGAGGSNGAQNFPVLIKLNSNNFTFADAKTNGEDIRFFDSDNSTSLSYEIESWDQSGEEAYIWVKVPQVDGNSATDSIIMYYGNAGASDAQSATAVWDANYQMVQHFQETDIDGGAGDIKDSTSNTNNGTTSGMDGSDQVSGQIGGSFDFDGTNDYVDYDPSLGGTWTAAHTVEMWVKLDTLANNDTFYGNATSDVTELLRLNSDASQKLQWMVYDETDDVWVIKTDTANAATGTWYHVAGTFTQNGNIELFVNGVSKGTSAIKTIRTSNAIGINIGDQYGEGSAMDGQVDEFRASTGIARSADYIKLSYESGRDNLNYYANRATKNDGLTYPASATWTSNAISPTGLYGNWGNLTFTDVETGGTVNYQVLDGSDVLIPDGTLAGNSTGFGTSPVSLATMTATAYPTIKVRATLTSGASTPSISAMSVTYTYDITPPSVPTNVSIGTVTNNSVVVSWDASTDTDSGLSGYVVQRAADSSGVPGTWSDISAGSCNGTIPAGTETCTDDNGLSADAKYWYRVRAVDNVNLDSYYYEKDITLDTSAQGANVGTNQSDFPIAVHINSASWTSAAERDEFFGAYNTAGKRVNFYDSLGTRLAHEVEYYDAGTEEAVYWVKVPTVNGSGSSGGITTLNVRYGNDPYAEDQSNTTGGVWSNNFRAVYHMNDATTSTINDSLGNHNGTKTAANEPIEDTAGQIGRAQDFDGTDDYIYANSVAGSSFFDGAHSLSGWGKMEDTGENQTLIGAGVTTSSNPYSELDWNTDTYYHMRTKNSTPQNSVASSSTYSDSNWHYLAGAVDANGGIVRFHVDAADQGSETTNSLDLSGIDKFYIGQLPYSSPNINEWFGDIDEVRVHSTERTTNWLKLEYYSMAKTSYNGDNGEGANPFVSFATGETATTRTLNATPSLNAPTTPTNDNTPEFTGTVSGAADGTTVRLYDGGVLKASTTTSSGAFTFDNAAYAAESETLTDGNHTNMTARSVNTDSVESPDSTARTVFVDTADPVTTYTTVPASPDGANGYFNTNPSITLVVTDPAPSGGDGTTQYKWDDAGFSSPTTYSGAIDMQATIGTGVHTLYWRTTDAAGNVESIQSQQFKLANLVSPPASVAVDYTNSASQTVNQFRFGWDHPVGITATAYYYKVNTPPTQGDATSLTSFNSCTISSTSYDVCTPFYAAALVNGSNTFYVVTQDDAMNVGWSQYAQQNFSINVVQGNIAVPTDISLTDSSSRNDSRWAITTSWNAPSPQDANFSSYIVERSTDGAAWTSVGETTALAYADTGLDTAESYYYRVKLKTDFGEESDPVTSANPLQPTGKYTTPPTITSGPAVTSATSSAATITWSTDRASSSFIEYGTTTDYGLSNGQMDAVTAHTVTISGLSPATSYNFRVQSLDEDRDYPTTMGYSANNVVTTSAAPAISEVSVSDITLNSAIVTWKTNTVSTSTVNYGKTSAYGSTVNDESGSAVTTHTVKLTGLDHSSTYNFRISGTDADGNVLSSDNYVFNTLTMPAISNVEYTQVADAATATYEFTWDSNVKTSSIVSYTESGSGDAKEAVKSAYVTSHGLQISNLKDNTTYTISVKGRDEYGNEAPAKGVTLKTDFDTRPPVISDIIAETSMTGAGSDAKGQLIISWTTDEPSTSQIEYGVGVSGDQYSSKTQEDSTLTTSHVVIISDLTPSTSYHFRVISKDAAENEAKSKDNSALTQQASDSIVDIIINSLDKTLGWIFRVLSWNF